MPTGATLCRADAPDNTVLNGRFKGGWTTRNYGKPDTGIHAVQMELAQSTYLTRESMPWDYDAAKATQLRSHLARILNTLADLAPSLAMPSGGST